MAQEINVIALVKGKERYVFLYDDNHRQECLLTLGRFASNPELSFTWYDAAVCSQKIRQESQKQTLAHRFNLPSGNINYERIDNEEKENGGLDDILGF